MRFRLPRLLPGFPAMLLVPAVLAVWAILNWTPQGNWGTYCQGFPYHFSEWDHSRGYLENDTYAFRRNLLIALATGYVVAMAVDRLVFPAIRGASRRKLGRGEAG